MNLNNFTLKAQESVQQAFNIASAKGQQAIECAHILKGIMNEAGSITGFIFGKFGINEANIAKQLDGLIATYPKVSGGEPYISASASEALRKAGNHASAMKDRFVTVEHLILGILDTGDQTSRIMKDSGATMKEMKARRPTTRSTR